MILATPINAPFPTAEFLRNAPADGARQALNCLDAAPSGSCEKRVPIGLLFDGTNNNLPRDRDGLRVVIDSRGKRILNEVQPARLPAADVSHSNVARLFQAYPTADFEAGDFAYNMPGVGTPFPAVGELKESSVGNAFAGGGQVRIIYAILNVVNSIYGAVMHRSLYNNAKIGKIAKSYASALARSNIEEPRTLRERHRDFFEDFLSSLLNARRSNPKPVITAVKIDVFGFSRGATEAVAFCHLLNDILDNGKLASIPTSINFLGVFDVVASVGISSSVAMTTFLPATVADGHFSWASRILDPLPNIVRAGRHFDDAVYELRADFAGRAVLNMYNPELPSLVHIDPAWDKFVDPDLITGPVDRLRVKVAFTDKAVMKSGAEKQLMRAVSGGWKIRYVKPSMINTRLNEPTASSNSADSGVLDASRQPRMPWNDVHCRIEGPAVADLTRNFVGRWNVISKAQLPAVKSGASYAKMGAAPIQVLRSASAVHYLKEFTAARKVGICSTQQDIQAAMQKIIAKATQFIYIENQFFLFPISVVLAAIAVTFLQLRCTSKRRQRHF